MISRQRQFRRYPPYPRVAWAARRVIRCSSGPPKVVFPICYFVCPPGRDAYGPGLSRKFIFSFLDNSSSFAGYDSLLRQIFSTLNVCPFLPRRLSSTRLRARYIKKIKIKYRINNNGYYRSRYVSPGNGLALVSFAWRGRSAPAPRGWVEWTRVGTATSQYIHTFLFVQKFFTFMHRNSIN